MRGKKPYLRFENWPGAGSRELGGQTLGSRQVAEGSGTIMRGSRDGELTGSTRSREAMGRVWPFTPCCCFPHQGGGVDKLKMTLQKLDSIYRKL